MPYDPKKHDRQSLRLADYDYAEAGFYFVTVCTQSKINFFGEVIDEEINLNEAGQGILKQWWDLSARFPFIKIHEHVVMPNHLHGIIEICDNTCRGEPCVRPIDSLPHGKQGEHEVRPHGTESGSLGSIMQAFKSVTTHDYIRGVKQFGWTAFPGKLWQRNYYEHIIRDEKGYDRISEYIVTNPERWDQDVENPKHTKVNEFYSWLDTYKFRPETNKGRTRGSPLR